MGLRDPIEGCTVHFVDDWLEHHSLDADVVRDVIAVAWARGGPETPFANRDFGDGTAQSVGVLGDLRTCYDDLVIPALSAP